MKKNIVILGGTSGVGKAIALGFRDDEARLLIIGRSEEKAQRVSHQAHGKIDFLIADLTNKNEQRKLIQEIGEKFDHIDALIDTFGVFPSSAEINIRTNLQAHAELIHLFVPLLEKSEQARVALVTGHFQVLRLGMICSGQKNTVERGIWEITHKTLLMKLASKELFEKNIMVNSFYPGDVQSDLMSWTKNLTNHSVAIGRRLALDERYTGVTGKMFDDKGNEVSLPEKYNAEVAREKLEKYIKNTI